jgi:hypothetical protein
MSRSTEREERVAWHRTNEHHGAEKEMMDDINSVAQKKDGNKILTVYHNM